jgi:hypothetical protein
MELQEPIHSKEYLSKMLVKITDSFSITHSIFTITRDNTTPNDVMLSNFKSKVYSQQIVAPLSIQHLWSFTYKDGNIQCLGHIINLAV